MKTEILKMLEFPRRLARGNLELEHCRHAGNYAVGDPQCVICQSQLECEWLYHSDEFSALQERELD